MARNTKFKADEMFSDLTQDTKEDIQDVQEVHEVQYVQQVTEPEQIQRTTTDKKMSMEEELKSTRGRKGMKLPYVHITCTQDVYEYITLESRRRGISRNMLVNTIIQSYMDSPEGHIVI